MLDESPKDSVCLWVLDFQSKLRIQRRTTSAIHNDHTSDGRDESYFKNQVCFRRCQHQFVSPPVLYCSVKLVIRSIRLPTENPGKQAAFASGVGDEHFLSCVDLRRQWCGCHLPRLPCRRYGNKSQCHCQNCDGNDGAHVGVLLTIRRGNPALRYKCDPGHQPGARQTVATGAYQASLRKLCKDC